MIAIGIATGISLIAWVFLLVGRGSFWIPRPRLDGMRTGMGQAQRGWPTVCAVIPARNEQDILGESLPSVLAQPYEGAYHVVVVDDRSTDSTGDVAQHAIERAGAPSRSTVLPGKPLPEGWAGKVWAMRQGAELAASMSSEYIWLTDADIAHDPGMLRALVDKATTENLDLVSIMARLRIDKGWDRLLIPAFVYFFAKLYPFRFVNDVGRRTAGAAGGCILVRRRALEEAGGFETMRSALIDDCALARLIKRRGGRIWLGFSRDVTSIRTYGSLRSIWDMIARSAYHQLGYSPTKLLATVLGMLLLYVTPPVAACVGVALAATGVPGAGALAVGGGAAWALMSASFVPILRHQGAGVLPAVCLPVAGILYTAMTISSAWRHETGRSRAWRG